MTSAITPPSRFSRCVVIVNPASTHYRTGKQRVKELEKLFPAKNFKMIETSREDYEHTDRLVGKLMCELDANTLLCIAAGDGTIGLIVNLLLTRPEVPATARQAVILPLWGGNANDFAFMLNGSVKQANITQIVTEGNIIAVHPLQMTITKDAEKRSKLAVCYVSFGASARAAHIMSRPGHRRNRAYRRPSTRLISEMANVTVALMRSKPFLCEIDGRQLTVFDLIMVNGPRMAKFNRLPMAIEQRGFCELRVQRKQPAMLPYAAKLVQSVNSRSKDGQIERHFTLRQAVWAQLDGEIQHVREYSQISVTSSDLSFRVLATKPHTSD